MNRWLNLEKAIALYGFSSCLIDARLIGANVRAVRETQGWGAVQKGEVGVLRHISSVGTAYAEFPSQSNWAGDWRCFEVAIGDEEDIL